MQRSSPPSDPLPPATSTAAQRTPFIGAHRLRQIMSIVMGGGLAMVALICLGELVLRDEYRPTSWLATIEARTDIGIWNQKLGAKPGELAISEADYRGKLAEAERSGQAKAELEYQKELAVVQADKERVVGAYQTLYQRANLIAQAGLQMEAVAQQFRQQLLTMSNGGRSMVIGIQDMLCAVGSEPACEAARAARAGMIAESDELSRGDVGEKIRALMTGIDDPATFIAHDDERERGTPGLPRD